MTTILLSFGGAQYPRAERLRHDAFAPSSNALSQALMSGGDHLIRPEDHLDLFDKVESWPDQLLLVKAWLKEKCKTGSSVTNLLIHYVGHGSFRRSGDGYFLSLNCTDPEENEVTSATLSNLQSMILRNAPHLRVFYIIDACFARNAFKDLMSPGGQEVLTAKVRQEIWDADVASGHADSGVAALCSSDKSQGSTAAGLGGLTQFTDGFITALLTGDATRSSRKISLSRLAEMVRVTLRSRYGDKAILPILFAPESGAGQIGNVPLFPNLATVAFKNAIKQMAQEDRVVSQNTGSRLAHDIAASLDDRWAFEAKVSELARLDHLIAPPVVIGPSERLDLQPLIDDVHRTRGAMQRIFDPLSILPKWLTWSRNLISPILSSVSHHGVEETLGEAAQLLERIRTVLSDRVAALSDARSALEKSKRRLGDQAMLASRVEQEILAIAQSGAQTDAGALDRLRTAPIRVAKETLQTALTEFTVRDRLIGQFSSVDGRAKRALAELDKIEPGYRSALSKIASLVGPNASTPRGSSRDSLEENAFRPFALELERLEAVLRTTFDGALSDAFLSISNGGGSPSNHGAEAPSSTATTPEGSRIAAADSVLAIDLDPSIAHDPGIVGMITMREIGARFYGLPLSKKSEIADRLQLLDEKDRACTNMSERFRFVLHRAHDRGKLDELAEAVSRAVTG